MMESVAIIRQGSKDAPRVQEILALPDDAWTDVEVSFSLDEPAIAKVSLILRGDQLVDLAKVAHKRMVDGFMEPEYPPEPTVWVREGD